MGFQNIIAGNGIGISITGMIIVYSGLMLISIFIAILPRILNRAGDVPADRHQAIKKEVVSPKPVEDDSAEDHYDIVSIICMVLTMEEERQGLSLAGGGSLNIWGTAGKGRIMPGRRIQTLL
ncbi:OadG family protein [bacterium]|nr:OadG family protein [bacterium]